MNREKIFKTILTGTKLGSFDYINETLKGIESSPDSFTSVAPAEYINETDASEFEPEVEFSGFENVVYDLDSKWGEVLGSMRERVHHHLGMDGEGNYKLSGINRLHGDGEMKFFENLISDGIITKKVNMKFSDDLQMEWKLAIFKGLIYMYEPSLGIVFRRRFDGDY